MALSEKLVAEVLKEDLGKRSQKTIQKSEAQFRYSFKMLSHGGRTLLPARSGRRRHRREAPARGLALPSAAGPRVAHGAEERREGLRGRALRGRPLRAAADRGALRPREAAVRGGQPDCPALTRRCGVDAFGGYRRLAERFCSRSVRFRWVSRSP